MRCDQRQAPWLLASRFSLTRSMNARAGTETADVTRSRCRRDEVQAPRSGSVVTGTEFLFPRRKAPTRAAFDPGLSLLTRESSHDTPVTAKPHRPAAQARMLERGFGPPTEGGGQPKTTKCQETASTDDRRSEWWAPCALTAHWHVAWWLAEMTVEKRDRDDDEAS